MDADVLSAAGLISSSSHEIWKPAAWRRVVPSPEPAEILELDMIKLLSGWG